MVESRSLNGSFVVCAVLYYTWLVVYSTLKIRSQNSMQDTLEVRDSLMFRYVCTCTTHMYCTVQALSSSYV